MKKSIALIFLSVILLFCSCTQETEESAPSSFSDEYSVPRPADPLYDGIPEGFSENEGQIGGFYVKITDRFKAEDINGDTIIVIKYEFTNNTDKATEPVNSLYDCAYQYGNALEKAVVNDPAVYDASTKLLLVQPGSTLEVQTGFVLKSETESVNFAIGPEEGFENAQAAVYAVVLPQETEDGTAAG